jgi:hypothetical protein
VTSTMLGCFRTQQKTREEVRAARVQPPGLRDTVEESLTPRSVLDLDPDTERCEAILVRPDDPCHSCCPCHPYDLSDFLICLAPNLPEWSHLKPTIGDNIEILSRNQSKSV